MIQRMNGRTTWRKRKNGSFAVGPRTDILSRVDTARMYRPDWWCVAYSAVTANDTRTDSAACGVTDHGRGAREFSDRSRVDRKRVTRFYTFTSWWAARGGGGDSYNHFRRPYEIRDCLSIRDIIMFVRVRIDGRIREFRARVKRR